MCRLSVGIPWSSSASVGSSDLHAVAARVLSLELIPCLVAPLHRGRTCARRFVSALCASRGYIRGCPLARLAEILSLCWPTTRWRWHRPQAASFVDVSQTLQPRLLWLFVPLQRGSADLAACRCAGPRTHRRVASVHHHLSLSLSLSLSLVFSSSLPMAPLLQNSRHLLLRAEFAKTMHLHLPLIFG